jgi:RimJ/RimL family protein N-acetyltransferase
MFAITERLLLRPGWSDDAPALTRAVANQKIVRNLALLPWPYSEGDARWFLDHVHSKGIPEFLIFTRTGGAPELVGGIGLHDAPEDPTGDPEIGYWIAEPHWGKGYATEAARAVVNMARHSLRLKSLKSGYFVDNPASGRVLRKLGFKPTGKVAQRHSNGRGETVPCILVERIFGREEADNLPAMPTRQMQMQMAA